MITLGQICCTKQILCMGSTPEEGFGFLLIFSSVPNLDGGEGVKIMDSAGIRLDSC